MLVDRVAYKFIAKVKSHSDGDSALRTDRYSSSPWVHRTLRALRL